jgi:hypothetical protein
MTFLRSQTLNPATANPARARPYLILHLNNLMSLRLKLQLMMPKRDCF